MSFSAEVKDELFRTVGSARHCQIAELAAIVGMCGRVMVSASDTYMLRVSTENVLVAKKYFSMVKSVFNVKPELVIKQSDRPGKSKAYAIVLRKHEDALKVLQAMRLIDSNNNLRENIELVDSLLIQQNCCKRAFLRGVFLAAGSISDPKKSYHMEVVCDDEIIATKISDLINSYDLNSKVIKRKKSYVTYLKEGAQIADVFAAMDASRSLFHFEDIRSIKDMKNQVNRKVNCETANLNKTIAAALKIIDDIKYIDETVGIDYLEPGLEELAKLRYENTDVSLAELGSMLSSPIGKSGVNHRLKKISEVAARLRADREEKL